MSGRTCDYCRDPIYESKDMGSYVSNLCERHYWKVREMAAEDALEDW